jgi:septum formation protein
MIKLPIYLASKSPRRHKLLKSLGIKFKVIIPRISEAVKESNPQVLAEKLAKRKVISVEGKVKRGIIIGVDTIVTINKKVLGKPKNMKDARRMLIMLSGKEHVVISGLFILCKPDNRSIMLSELTKVKFRKLTTAEIEKYIHTTEPYDKAGAYGIQGNAGLFVERITGCYHNVVGLPVTRLLDSLKKITVVY